MFINTRVYTCQLICSMIGFVPRYKEIEVEYESMRSGQRIVKVKQQLKDMAARVFQVFFIFYSF